MHKALKPSLIAASILLALSSQQASATNGYAAHGFGMTQKAMGGTAVAGSDNAMNIATNPASMSFGSNNWTAGMDIFIPDRGMNTSGRQGHPDIPLTAFFPPQFANFLPAGAVVPADGGIGGSDLKGNDDTNFPIPEFGYQRHIGDGVSLGLAVYGNGGMNATYDRPIFAGQGSRNTGIDFAQVLISPSIAKKIGENHSVGLSLNLAYQRMSVNGVSAFTPFSSDPTNLSDKDYDYSTGAGATIGWQGKLSDRLTLGLAYRSKTQMSRFDQYAGLLAEQGNFDIPSQITAGASFKMTPKTTLALDVARINYTDVAAISNKNNTAGLQQQLVGGAFTGQSGPLQGPKLGDDDGAGFGWEDQTVIKLGIKHQLNGKMTLLAGYNHGDAPIPDDQTAFNVLAPATVEDHLTLGLEYKLSKNSGLTFSYMHAFNNEIKGDASRGPGPFGPGTGAPLAPGAVIGIGANPLTDFSAANIEMNQNSFGIAYSKNF